MLEINIESSVEFVGKEIESYECSYHVFRRKNQRIDLKNYDNLCYLKTGSVSVYRAQNNILTITIKAPAIIGLAQLRNDKKSHYLRCDSDCEMFVMGKKDAEELFTRKGLWQHAFDLLTHHLQRYFDRENLLSHSSTRDVVIEHIKHIWSLPYEERNRISMYNFILSRTLISRSSVHKVLMDLKRNGVITIARGKLIELKMEF